MNSFNYWFIQHKEKLGLCGLLFIAFLIGLFLPSPFFREGLHLILGSEIEELVDTTNMVIDGGDIDLFRGNYDSFKKYIEG